MTKRAFVLWKLELKRTIRQLPVILAEAVLLLSILGMIAFGAAKLLYRDVPAIRITIAVIEKEKNPLTDLLLNYIQGMESISELCQFLIVSEEEGFAMLQEGKAAAALVLPEGMVEGIMDGSNTPVQVFFPEDAGMESALLRELTDAGVQMLRVAQAEIYGIYDTAKTYGALEQLSVLEMDIDTANLAFALDRLALFRVQEVSATGNLSVMQYGIASGAVFFLLLLGMACYPVMQPYPAALRKQLVREGIGAGGQCFGKWLCGVCGMGIGGLFFRLVVKSIDGGRIRRMAAKSRCSTGRNRSADFAVHRDFYFPGIPACGKRNDGDSAPILSDCDHAVFCRWVSAFRFFAGGGAKGRAFSAGSLFDRRGGQSVYRNGFRQNIRSPLPVYGFLLGRRLWNGKMADGKGGVGGI